MGFFGSTKEAPVTGVLTIVFTPDTHGVVTYTLDRLPGRRVWLTAFGDLSTEEELSQATTVPEMVNPMVSRALEMVCVEIPSLKNPQLRVHLREAPSGGLEVLCAGAVDYLPSEWRKLSSQGRHALEAS